ncbi:putative Na+/H+ antiporter [Pseudoduganella lurida]|uniref:Putative Na+/H+ antiporter n=1 Tax=Pseudoduganella lurida TaxID=1036180 RepID=A0A562R8X7_9BURK|nr:putative Na+/H+ antiporter [Pseudoduganella lurida]TWI65528.1 putative Na+/H+ antiporter [Pseudoduganella lurida]
MAAGPIEIAGAVLFAIAILHTFAAAACERLARRFPAHAGIWHLLGEVEVVFGFWALVLVAFIAVAAGPDAAIAYLDGRNFTEPLFVFVVMVIAATRPILNATRSVLGVLARWLPLPGSMAMYFVVLAVVPLLGSFITEPAAMTLAALILGERLFAAGPSAAGLSVRLKYATLGVLFVNVSIGGTLTPYAAPPVLMVAAAWDWDLPFMLANIGWKAALAVLVNAAGVTLLFAKELAAQRPVESGEPARMPFALVLVHFAFLAGVVLSAHHSAVFLGLFLFFLGVTHAYARFNDRLILREGLLVGFFLAGLVVLGGQQAWWLQPLLLAMSSDAVFYGATALTAVTDNAALTYLGSLVTGLSDEFKYALVTGAVAGGGLTVIANAPNPAGMAILKGHFDGGAVSAGGLLLAALAPTAVAVAAFRLL